MKREGVADATAAIRPRQGLLALIAVGLLLVTAATSVLTDALRRIVSADALNATASLALPRWLDDLTQESVIAYPAHVTLGVTLEALQLSPAATAVQWFKAAAHAPTEAELARTARAMAAAYQRDTTDGRTFRTLCNLKEVGNRDQIQAIEHAGIPCERWTPHVALTATPSATLVEPGATVEVTASVTSATTVTGLVDIEVHDANGDRVAQWVTPDQELRSGQRSVYVVTWTVPPDLPSGEYTVKLGVFLHGWAVLHGWKNSAASITVIE